MLRFCELSILLARHKVAMEYQLIFRKTYDVTNHAHQNTAYARMSIPLQILLCVGATLSHLLWHKRILSSLPHMLQPLQSVHLPCSLLYTVPRQWSGNGGMGPGSWRRVVPTRLHLYEQDGESAASPLNTVCVYV